MRSGLTDEFALMWMSSLSHSYDCLSLIVVILALRTVSALIVIKPPFWAPDGRPGSVAF
jgi:hypothetical protein